MANITNEDIFKLISEGNKELKRDILEIKKEFSRELISVKNKNKELENEIELLKSKLYHQERKLKKFNIVIYGLTGNENTTAVDALKVINNTLNIDCTIDNFRDIYRVGKKSEDKARPTILEVINYNLKSKILDQAKNKKSQLRTLAVNFASDIPSDDYKKRKFLGTYLKIALEKELTAYIKNNTLYINKKEYSFEQLQNFTTEEINDKLFKEAEGLQEGVDLDPTTTNKRPHAVESSEKPKRAKKNFKSK